MLFGATQKRDENMQSEKLKQWREWYEVEARKLVTEFRGSKMSMDEHNSRIDELIGRYWNGVNKIVNEKG